MGQKDIVTKKYLARNDVFADAFNYFLFDGEEVIKAEDLKEQDPTELVVIEKMDRLFTNQKMRDVLKLCTVKHSEYATLILFGIEGQANIHYAMPVRDYFYDALNYASQVELIRKRHEEIGDLTGDERLSGFSKEDHIIPVITLCICFDKKKWDAPRSLFDMFGEIDPKLAKYVDDYRLNLISPDEIDDFNKFSSELGMVMEFIHASDDKERLRGIIESINDKSMYVETVDMINTYLGARISTKYAKGGRVKVCQGLQELMEDERNEGRIEGRNEGRIEGRNEGANMLAKLLRMLTPGSEDYNKALDGDEQERTELYKKYDILD